MKIDNHIGQAVRMYDDYLEKTYLGHAFPTIGREASFLFVADEPCEKLHSGPGVVDDYIEGFPYPKRCWWVSRSKLEDVPNKLLLQ